MTCIERGVKHRSTCARGGWYYRPSGLISRHRPKSIARLSRSALQRQLFAEAAGAWQQGLEPPEAGLSGVAAAIARALAVCTSPVAMSRPTISPNAPKAAAKTLLLLLLGKRRQGGRLVDIDWSVCSAGCRLRFVLTCSIIVTCNRDFVESCRARAELPVLFSRSGRSCCAKREVGFSCTFCGRFWVGRFVLEFRKGCAILRDRISSIAGSPRPNPHLTRGGSRRSRAEPSVPAPGWPTENLLSRVKGIGKTKTYQRSRA